MKTTKTDEAKSEDDLEEEYKVTRNHRHKWHVGNLSFVVVARLSLYYSRVLFLLCRAR